MLAGLGRDPGAGDEKAGSRPGPSGVKRFLSELRNVGNDQELCFWAFSKGSREFSANGYRARKFLPNPSGDWGSDNRYNPVKMLFSREERALPES